MIVDEILQVMRMVKPDTSIYIQEHHGITRYPVSSIEIGEDGFVIHYKE